MTMDDWSRREFIATGLSAGGGLLIAAATVSREHGSDARSVVEEPDGALVVSVRIFVCEQFFKSQGIPSLVCGRPS